MSEPLRVLIVEDNEDDALLIMRQLRSQGFDVSWERVQTTSDMRSALQTRPWDVVISDFHLPKITVQQALEVLKRSTLDLPFIVVSGTIGEETAVEMMKAGCHDYLMKDRLMRLPEVVRRELREARIRAERRKTDEVLRQRNEQLRGIAAHIPGVVCQFKISPDEPIAVSYVSERCSEVLGLPDNPIAFLEQFRGQLPASDRQRFDQSLRDAAAAFRNWNFDGRLDAEDGNTKWIKGMASPSRSEDAVVLNGILLDVTEQQKISEQLSQAQRVESVGRLAAGVAHDFNNMLTPILGYAEMLISEGNSPERQREQLLEIKLAAERAQELTRQLLAFGRRQTLQIRPVDLNVIIAGMEKLLRRTLQESVSLRITLHPKPCTILADTGQVEQILMNLAINAQDAMPDGGTLNIEVSQAELDETYRENHPVAITGSYGALIVSDTGYGMSEETRRQIFEPFFSTKGEMGTGMGLATVYGIVKQHGGLIWVYSELGKGTTFKVYLPASSLQSTPAANKGPALKELRGSETVILVEDNQMVRDLATAVLERQGYTVLAANGGPEALTLLGRNSESVRLIVTDVVMPGMNGQQLYREASRLCPGIKVLFMSGYTGNVIAQHGILEGGTAFIQKPFSVQGLAAKVREVLADS
ncbi:MAG: response regulator [Candidatus Hydrogenedentes bacterium]|nr:response regulator [Candidatus Hydrogenedentota bacterium]